MDITGGMGVTTILKLLEFGYKRLHYEVPYGKILSSKEKQRQLDSFKKDEKTPGFQIGTVRLSMIQNFEEKVRNNVVKIRSTRLINEIKTFIYKNGRPDHMDGYHDDLVMSLAMCLWVVEHSFKNLEKVEKQAKAMLESWLTVGGEVKQPNVSRGTGFVPRDSRQQRELPKPKFSPIVSKNMQDPTGQYLWLFSGTK